MMSTGMPSSKRHFTPDYWSTSFLVPQSQSLLDSPTLFGDDDYPWNMSLTPLDPLPSQTIMMSSGLDGPSASRSKRKRAHDEHEQPQSQSGSQNALLQFSVQPSHEIGSWWESHFPEFNPSLPSSRSREGAIRISNPFEEVAARRHHNLKPPIRADNVNGYLKYRLLKEVSSAVYAGEKPFADTISYRNSNGAHRPQLSEPSRINASIPTTPVGLGRSFRFDRTDQKLMKFFVSAMCSGRTLCPNTNGWLKDLAPMAETDEMMRHAILAFSAGYVLDIVPTDELLNRANYHYERASRLLSTRLESPDVFVIGKEDPVVGCLRVLWCDDIVQWELRRDKNQVARWFQAVQQGKKIMARTDPGFRYYRHVTNVQWTSARTSNANMMAFVDLVANMTRPLSARESSDENLHPWLLEGTDRESRRIYGGTGLCPKLLHMFGQITHLTARMNEDVSSTIIPLGAKAIAQKLVNFYQWSELSDGHASPEILLQACCLDKEGLVGTKYEVTELSGEAWVQAARIYLQIRFFRLPRDHPRVQQPFRTLCRILERLPCSGHLFTSQTPFFPVFLAGLIATSTKDRLVVRNWFETVVFGASARSNVPPIWRVLQETWTWMDQDQIDDDIDDVDQKSIGERLPWWERLVSRWKDHEGILSIV